MRIAIVSDIHGNRTAFEAVLADLRHTSPDLILHGGDLADSGANPVDIVDRIRDLGWQGVVGNTDEMLIMPEVLKENANQSPELQPLFAAIQVMATATCEALGEEDIELEALDGCGVPHADWVAKVLRSGCFQMP
jgi:Icc-related predicted phosphoesterase